MEIIEIFVIKDEIDLNDELDIVVCEEYLIIFVGVEVYEINGLYFFGIVIKFEEIMV